MSWHKKTKAKIYIKERGKINNSSAKNLHINIALFIFSVFSILSTQYHTSNSSYHNSSA